MAKIASGKEGKYNDASNWTGEIPRTIYFYYLEPAGAGKYSVRAYMWVNPDNVPIHPGAELNGLIGDLTVNARQKGNNPRSIGSGFTVPWWRKSYFVVALDHSLGFEPGDAIEILHVDGSDKPNHTFFDGWDGMMWDTNGRPIAVMWTVNYMKRRDGANLGKYEVHRFKLGFKGRGRRIFEGGDHGTNMGPPIGPP